MSSFDPNAAIDLSKLVPMQSLVEGFGAGAKVTQIDGPNGEKFPLPVLELRFRINGREQVITLTPDLCVPIAHTLLGFQLSLSQAPPVPPGNAADVAKG